MNEFPGPAAFGPVVLWMHENDDVTGLQQLTPPPHAIANLGSLVRFYVAASHVLKVPEPALALLATAIYVCIERNSQNNIDTIRFLFEMLGCHDGAMVRMAHAYFRNLYDRATAGPSHDMDAFLLEEPRLAAIFTAVRRERAWRRMGSNLAMRN